ncbi:Uu.00g137760.m01.CDS01 [Anthostomella pinea]|uniref:Uu.00g137760.m01.CDS01 n=1 Tax=Anthostomella pinea TaxID=933095 RepID=A0AAI8YL94_9PEZI|nr:Uu.00g137760.m01.CDS01 [Anthostomella pinea]
MAKQARRNLVNHYDFASYEVPTYRVNREARAYREQLAAAKEPGEALVPLTGTRPRVHIAPLVWFSDLSFSGEIDDGVSRYERIRAGIRNHVDVYWEEHNADHEADRSDPGDFEHSGIDDSEIEEDEASTSEEDDLRVLSGSDDEADDDGDPSSLGGITSSSGQQEDMEGMDIDGYPADPTSWPMVLVSRTQSVKRERAASNAYNISVQYVENGHTVQLRMWYGDGNLYVGPTVPASIQTAFNYTVPDTRADLLYITPSDTTTTASFPNLPDPTFLVLSNAPSASDPLFFTHSVAALGADAMLFWTRYESMLFPVPVPSPETRTWRRTSTSRRPRTRTWLAGVGAAGAWARRRWLWARMYGG